MSTLPVCPTNRRTSRRKGLRTPATLIPAGQPERAVTTVDLGLDGLSLRGSRPVPPGTRCEVRFVLRDRGREQAVAAAAKVVYSSFCGSDGFKLGLVFGPLPDAVAAAIDAFLAP